VEEGRHTAIGLAKVKGCLQRMEYQFIEEISMVGCRDLYIISKRIVLAMGKGDEPFGGVNVILAGDFAQLPPVNRNPSLYSDRVGTKQQIGDNNYA
jgi:hypothetical protein